MSKQSASVSALEELHSALAQYFKSRLTDSMADPEDEDDFKLPLATGEVANMVTFLKHNDISAAPADEALSELKDEFAKDLEAQRIAKAESLLKPADEDSEVYEWLK